MTGGRRAHRDGLSEIGDLLVLPAVRVFELGFLIDDAGGGCESVLAPEAVVVVGDLLG